MDVINSMVSERFDAGVENIFIAGSSRRLRHIRVRSPLFFLAAFPLSTSLTTLSCFVNTDCTFVLLKIEQVLPLLSRSPTSSETDGDTLRCIVLQMIGRSVRE